MAEKQKKILFRGNTLLLYFDHKIVLDQDLSKYIVVSNILSYRYMYMYMYTYMYMYAYTYMCMYMYVYYV